MKLTSQNGKGQSSNQPLPTLTIQTFSDEQTAQLAVMFDVKSSPDMAFYPNFITKSQHEIAQLQQDFLWEKSCYELFLAFEKGKNSPYVEINFSPSGEFNLYQFDSYRMPQQIPPRRLDITESQRQNLLNFYRVSDDNLPVFWQNSLSPKLNLTQSLEKNYPLSKDSHRLVMLLDIQRLAELLKVKTEDKIWLNPCAVFKGEQELVYFAHQHANPPNFHDKNNWLEMAI